MAVFQVGVSGNRLRKPVCIIYYIQRVWEYFASHNEGLIIFSPSHFEIYIFIVYLTLFSPTILPIPLSFSKDSSSYLYISQFWQGFTLMWASNKYTIIYSCNWVTIYLLESRQGCYSVLSYCFPKECF